MQRRTLLGGVAGGAYLATAGCTGKGNAEQMPTQSAQGTQPGGKIPAVYYQPRLQDLQDPKSVEVPAAGVFTMVAEPGQATSWTGSVPCTPINAGNFLRVPEARDARLVVGMSLGRIGLAYLLGTNPELPNVRQMAAVVPGNTEDFTDSCDPADTSARVDHWLDTNQANQFTVYADARTAEEDYRGIHALYLSKMSPTVFGQVAIYQAGEGHEEVWNRVKGGLFAAATAASAYVPPNAALWRPA